MTFGAQKLRAPPVNGTWVLRGARVAFHVCAAQKTRSKSAGVDLYCSSSCGVFWSFSSGETKCMKEAGEGNAAFRCVGWQKISWARLGLGSVDKGYTFGPCTNDHWTVKSNGKKINFFLFFCVWL